ncbi:hypothetical protein GW915_08610 [bacterium]|nr:hypothetical protein [bacterium]
MRVAALFAGLCLWTLNCFAQIQVAFFEKFNEQGERVELEDGGRFFHVAVKVGEFWLHTDSFYGVSLVETVPKSYGRPLLRLYSPDKRVVHFSDVERLLGVPYDRDYLWDNEKLYCSELVSKLLGLKPRPMSFNGNHWKDHDQSRLPNGELGSSPDFIFQQLLSLGWTTRCEDFY